jgi:hypothetical protein
MILTFKHVNQDGFGIGIWWYALKGPTVAGIHPTDEEGADGDAWKISALKSVCS